ncbi:MAG: GtrA family protein [bacterium]
MKIPNSVERVLKFGVVGVLTFALDLILLYVCIDWLEWNYIIATGIAFTMAVSVNYYGDRRWVFKGTLRSIRAGYVIFMVIGCVGAAIAMVGMSVLVGVFHIHYFASRIAIASLVGLWNYFMNLYVNFQVTGKHGEAS